MKPSKETVNKLRKLQAYLRAEPSRFDMDFWGLAAKNLKELKTLAPYDISSQYGGVYCEYVKTVTKQSPPCGTVACLAGNVAIMNGLVKPTFTRGYQVYKFPEQTPQRAARWLGISTREAARLFYTNWQRDHPDCWPKQFCSAYSKAKLPKEKADIACERIDHYIKTGE